MIHHCSVFKCSYLSLNITTSWARNMSLLTVVSPSHLPQSCGTADTVNIRNTTEWNKTSLLQVQRTLESRTINPRRRGIRFGIETAPWQRKAIMKNPQPLEKLMWALENQIDGSRQIIPMAAEVRKCFWLLRTFSLKWFSIPYMSIYTVHSY